MLMLELATNTTKARIERRKYRIGPSIVTESRIGPASCFFGSFAPQLLTQRQTPLDVGFKRSETLSVLAQPQSHSKLAIASSHRIRFPVSDYNFNGLTWGKPRHAKR